MSHNYSLPTVKALFGEASSCAYPGCDEPLVFRDRGALTIVAQIAHIRSERPNGPRFDPDYPPEFLDEHENLLLLCGRHHPPVDRHESLYSTEELLSWKQTQVAGAGPGTEISEAEARRFARLADEERQALAQIARLARRATATADRAQRAVDEVDRSHRDASREAQRRTGPIYEVDDAGNRTNITHRLELSEVEKRKFRGARNDAIEDGRRNVAAAVEALAEELAVLKMMSEGRLALEAARATVVGEGLVDLLGSTELVEQQSVVLSDAIGRLWAVANGEPLSGRADGEAP